MSSTAVTFDRVWKAYPRWSPGTRTLRAILSRRVPLLARGGEHSWALQDVTLRIERGRSVGLVGPNGAGKSTFLRLAAGLSRPSRGRIAMPENAASVLSLGDAFDLSLSGRENAMTTALVAGLRRRQALARIPSALEFAELEPYADAPMRTYSDGMRLRLAFGVIAQLQPAVLLLDEVIAVGDLRFQEKCTARMREMRESGTTILFASHSLDQVASETELALWLQGGAVRSYGDSAAVTSEYRTAMHSETLDRTPAAVPGNGSELELRRNRFGSQAVTIEAVTMRGGDGSSGREITSGGSLSLSLELQSHEGAIAEPIVGVAIHRAADGVVCFDSSTDADGVRLERVEGRAEVTIVFHRLDLAPDEYVIDVGVYQADWEHAYDYHWHAYPFRVIGGGGGTGVLRPPHHWKVELDESPLGHGGALASPADSGHEL